MALLKKKKRWTCLEYHLIYNADNADDSKHTDCDVLNWK